MPQTWTEQINRRDRDRKAKARAAQIRAASTRRANRRHMVEHPIRHAFGALFGR